MNKLKLSLEDLQVDTFTTVPTEKKAGTVFGEQCTCYTNCTCPGCPTCDASCEGTSCDGGCGSGNLSCADSCMCMSQNMSECMSDCVRNGFCVVQ